MVTLTSAKTLMVNSAFLQEIKDSNPELWQTVHQLRQLCQSNDDPGIVSKRLVRLLDDLRDCLAMQFALEESFGYIEVASGGALTTANELAIEAKNQHCALYLRLSELAELAEEVQYRGVVREQLQSLIDLAKSFDAKLREHEALECELIEQSFDLPCRVRPR